MSGTSPIPYQNRRHLGYWEALLPEWVSRADASTGWRQSLIDQNARTTTAGHPSADCTGRVKASALARALHACDEKSRIFMLTTYCDWR